MTSFAAKAFDKIRIQIEDIVWHRSMRGAIVIFLNIIYRRRFPLPVVVYEHFTKTDEANGDDDFGDEAFLVGYMIPEQGKCLVDVGAATGLWTLFVAKKGVQVYCFEPSPKSYTVLKRKTQAYSNVHAYPYALGDKDSIGRLGLAAFSLSGTMDAEIKGLHKGGTIDIPVRSLDSLGIVNIGIIKIDTEGYEIPILQGARATIEKDRPRLIVEVHRGTGKAAKTFAEELQRIEGILKAYGYTWVLHNRQISLRDIQPHLIAEPKA
jgi:FkbM family methyltransferase